MNSKWVDSRNLFWSDMICGDLNSNSPSALLAMVRLFDTWFRPAAVVEAIMMNETKHVTNNIFEFDTRIIDPTIDLKFDRMIKNLRNTMDNIYLGSLERSFFSLPITSSFRWFSWPVTNESSTDCFNIFYCQPSEKETQLSSLSIDPENIRCLKKVMENGKIFGKNNFTTSDRSDDVHNTILRTNHIKLSK